MMEFRDLKTVIEGFNNNPNLDDYSKILDLQNIHRHKCRICGRDIFYRNTRMHMSKIKPRTIRVSGTSYITSKSIHNTIFPLTVCQTCLEGIHPEVRGKSRVFNVMSNATKFAFNIPDDLFISARKQYGSSLEHKITKYGEEEGNRRWNEYVYKQSITNTFEYKRDKYGMTRREFNKYNLSRATTLRNLVNRYGEEEGNRRWNTYLDKQRLTKSWDYMVKKFGVDKARAINQSKVISLDKLIRKYGEKIGRERYNKYLRGRASGYSVASQIIFQEIDSCLNNRFELRYASKNSEYTVIDDEGKVYKLDFYIPELRICIEYNGTCFHGDPRIYKSEDHCNPFTPTITAGDIWNRDKARYEYLLNRHNIKTYIIWELDVKSLNIKDYIINVLGIELE